METAGLKLQIVADVNDAVSGLNSTAQAIAALKVEQRVLSGEMATNTAALKTNAAELQKNLAIEQTAIKNKLVHGQAYKDLKTQIQAQQAEEQRLTSVLMLKNSQLDASKTQLKAYTVELNNSTAGAGKLGRAVTNLTDANSLAAGGVMRLRRMLIGSAFTAAAFAITEGLMPAIAALVKSFEHLNKANEQYKINQKTLNEVVDDGNKKAGEQINSLKILYAEATNLNGAMDLRLKAVQALKTEFPDYFSKLNDETILNGKAQKSYDDLTESIIKSSRAKAAKDRMDDLQKQLLDVDFQKQKINNAVASQKNNAKAELPSVTDFNAGSTGPGASTLGPDRMKTVGDVRAFLEEGRVKAISIQDKIADNLKSQIKFLSDFVGESELAKAAIADAGKGTKPKKGEAPQDADKAAKEKFLFEKGQLDNKHQYFLDAETKNQTLTDKRKFEIDKDYLEKLVALEIQYHQYAGKEVLKLDQLIIAERKRIQETMYSTNPGGLASMLESLKSHADVMNNMPAAKQMSAMLNLMTQLIQKGDLWRKNVDSAADAVSGVLDPAFQQMFTDVTNGTKSMGEAFKSMLADLTKSLISTFLKAAALAAILSLLPGGSAAAGGEGFLDGFKRLSGLSGLKPFAAGGIFTSPTQMGSNLFGEAGPEAVVPLNRLNEFASTIGGGAGNGGTLTATVTGEQLTFILNRTAQSRNRAY